MFVQQTKPPGPVVRRTLRVRSQIKAGRLASNRCEELAALKTIRVRSQIKAGRLAQNRCEVLAKA